MIDKNVLQSRVNERKQEIAGEEARLGNVLGVIGDFVDDIKSRSAIYALIKNLTLWKKLEELLGGGPNAD